MQNLVTKTCVPDVETHIKRFPNHVRSALRVLIRECPPVADLLLSFPAIAYALIAGYGNEADRSNTLRLVNSGQPLRIIAEALGLPYWLRKAPIEALKNGLGYFPKDPEFHKKIAGAFPYRDEAMANWLVWVPLAARYGHKDFAVWLARQKKLFANENVSPDLVIMLSVYAWFSVHKEELAGTLIQDAWNKKVKYDTAFACMHNWFNQVKVKLFFGSNGIEDSWLHHGRAGSLYFIPLLTAEQLEQEGKQMGHCVGDYCLDVARADCRIFSIRRGGKHIATLEIRSHYSHTGIPVIEQLYGPNNEEVPAVVWKATFAWISKQSSYNLPAEKIDPKPDCSIWKKMWEPYWSEKGSVSLLPEAANAQTITHLETILNV